LHRVEVPSRASAGRVDLLVALVSYLVRATSCLVELASFLAGEHRLKAFLPSNTCW